MRECAHLASNATLPVRGGPISIVEKQIEKQVAQEYIKGMELEFEWDTAKEQSNIRKHGVSFHEGATVFGDPLSWTFPDPDHSVGEERFLTIGLSVKGRTIVVSHTDRGIKTRIINARKATPHERKDYEKG